jgi:hypothetical protein
VVAKKYLHDEPIAVVRDNAKSLNIEVDDFLTLAQLYGGQ